MPLIVEDGTGLTTAEAYVSVANANTYHTLNGNSAWTGTDDVKAAALRRASRYLDTTYTFVYDVKISTQALQWPRSYYLWTDPEVKRLKDACCELAMKALTIDLFADVDAQHVTSVTIGPITRALSAPRNGGQKRYAAVDALVEPLLESDRGTAKLVRA